MSIVVSNAFHRPAAFQAVYVRQASGKWQTLGSIVGGTISFPNYEEMDSVGRNKSHGISVVAKCNMKQASLVEIELLPTLCNGANDFLFKMADAATVSTSAAYEGWILLTAEQIGVKAKVVLDGTPENNRKIELDWMGSVKFSEWGDAIKPTLIDTDFEVTGGSGTFKEIGTYTAAKDGGQPTNDHMVPSGVASVTICTTGGSPLTLGKVNNVKGSLEFIAEPDGLKRHDCFAVKIDLAYDWMQTDATNLLQIDEFAQLNPDVVATFYSGLILTLTNTAGISTNYNSSADYSKQKVVGFKHTGSIPMTAFTGIVSEA